MAKGAEKGWPQLWAMAAAWREQLGEKMRGLDGRNMDTSVGSGWMRQWLRAWAGGGRRWRCVIEGVPLGRGR